MHERAETTTAGDGHCETMNTMMTSPHCNKHVNTVTVKCYALAIIPDNFRQHQTFTATSSIQTYDNHTNSSSHVNWVKHKDNLLTEHVNAHCVSLPGKHFISLSFSELTCHYLPSRSLCSSNTNLLTRPPGITSTFQCHLKFHLLQSAFTV